MIPLSKNSVVMGLVPKTISYDSKSLMPKKSIHGLIIINIGSFASTCIPSIMATTLGLCSDQKAKLSLLLRSTTITTCNPRLCAYRACAFDKNYISTSSVHALNIIIQLKLR